MKLHYREYGDGTPLVILHGLFGSADNWHTVAQKVRPGFRVIVPDLPNHGASPHLDRANYETMVSAVGEFVDGLSLKRPVVAGHSMGGKIAMLLALRRSIDVAALVVVDMAPRPYDPSHVELLETMRSMSLSGLTRRADADQAISAAIPDPAVRAFLLKNLHRDDSGFRWRLNLDAISRDYLNILEWDPPPVTYSGPALFVGGELSNYLQPTRDGDIIRQAFPNAIIEIVPGAGHWLHAERQGEFLTLLNRFLGRIPMNSDSDGDS